MKVEGSLLIIWERGRLLSIYNRVSLAIPSQ